jgi:homoserine O-acetyltransferase
VPNEYAGINGLRAARAMAMLSYRHYDAYKSSQADAGINKYAGFKAESYQYYQGEKLALRFNAWSYYALTRSMDSHNLASHEVSVQDALNKIKAKVLVIGIESDVLFPVEEQLYIARQIPNAVFSLIDSPFGHDGFLIEYEQVSEKVKPFIKQQQQTVRI